MQSVCVDAQGRVTGVCPDDLTGGCGWHRIESDLTPSTCIYNEFGAALYKMVDGVVMPRCAEEIKADEPKHVTELTDIEKLKIRTAANEDALAGMMDLMMGGML